MPDYKQAASDHGEFTTATFSLRKQEATLLHYVDDVDDLAEVILDLIGDTEPSGLGGLKRKRPRCHLDPSEWACRSQCPPPIRSTR